MIYGIMRHLIRFSHHLSNNDFIIRSDTVKVDECIIAYRYVVTILAVEVELNSFHLHVLITACNSNNFLYRHRDFCCIRQTALLAAIHFGHCFIKYIQVKPSCLIFIFYHCLIHFSLLAFNISTFFDYVFCDIRYIFVSDLFLLTVYNFTIQQ